MTSRSGLLALALLLQLAAAVGARAADAGFQVSSAWVNVRGAVFEVNARVDYPLDERMQQALDAGATLHFDLECVVEQQNRYWFDTTLVDVVLRRELAFSGVTQRYVLRTRDDGTPQSFATLEEALVAAGEVIDWPVVVEPQLDPDSTYRIRVRASYRRGSPARLRALLPWFDGWNRQTEWHAWVLPH